MVFKGAIFDPYIVNILYIQTPMGVCFAAAAVGGVGGKADSVFAKSNFT